MHDDHLPPAEQIQLEPFDSARDFDAFVRRAIVVAAAGVTGLFLIGFACGAAFVGAWQ